jgi:hypothetical protein
MSMLAEGARKTRRNGSHWEKTGYFIEQMFSPTPSWMAWLESGLLQDAENALHEGHGSSRAANAMLAPRLSG